MIEKIFLKFGPGPSITFISLISVASSVMISAMLWRLADLPNMKALLLIAVLCPALIAPPVAWSYCRLITKLHRNKQALEKRNQELADLLADIKSLSRMLPICASCRKIRDDQGNWSKLEAYVEIHAKVEFSHSMCPDCSHNLYPELYQDCNSEPHLAVSSSPSPGS